MAARVASSVSAHGAGAQRRARRPAVASAASVARVGVVQLARAQRAAGRDELVARGQDRDARARARSATRPAAGDDGDADLGRRPCACPRGRTVSPARRSSPAGRTLRPGATSSSSVTVSPSTVDELDLQHARRRRRASRRRSRSAPPRRRRRRPSAGAPARDSPTMRSARPAGPERTAKPSIALLAKAGTSRSADDVLGQRRGRARPGPRRPRRAAGARRRAPARAPRRS